MISDEALKKALVGSLVNAIDGKDLKHGVIETQHYVIIAHNGQYHQLSYNADSNRNQERMRNGQGAKQNEK